MPGEPILIVDDTPVNLKLTRMLLQHEGYEVRTAASAEEALEVLETFHPRLVLADIQLPGIDGLEMTRRIKSDPRNHDVLVVALTAYAMKGDEDKAMEAGCDGYITKPIDTRALGTKLRDYLDLGCPAPADGAAPALPLPPRLVPDEEMQELRERFLTEGLRMVRLWTDELYGPFHPEAASSVAHQWVGSGGLLGFLRISELAREAEHALKERPLDAGQFRELLESLEAEFRSPTPADQMPARPPEPETPTDARVLIADDDPNMLALVKAIVQTQSIECHTAADGHTALEMIRQIKPDAVVLDVNMPGMSGYQVLEKLREEGVRVKVLLLTADDHPTATADDYLLKPFNPIDLVVRLKRML
jgi:two-component system, cell cycle response regulator DivK